jgi:hypothetical protein
VAGLTVAAGYASEALPQTRRLLEFAARAQYLIDDPTGQRAEAWMTGRGKKPAALVGHELWKELSPSSHADGYHLRWMSQRSPQARVFTFATRSQLDVTVCLAIAVGAKDLADVVHLYGGLKRDAIQHFNRQIDQAIEALESSGETISSTGSVVI